jgi:hypothetical protein
MGHVNGNIPSVQQVHAGVFQFRRATGNIGFVVFCTCCPFQIDVPAEISVLTTSDK